MLILHHLKSPSDLLQVDGRMDPTICWPKDEVTDPRARILETQAPLRLVPKLGNHLPHNIYLEDFGGQVPKHELSDRRHRRLERGKLHGHLGMTGSSKPHSLM
jgi:hypothetical protein